MEFSSIKTLLNNKIGLASATLGKDAVERTVKRLMEKAGCSNELQYSTLLLSDEKKLQELIEEVVVPETWFFREKESFDILQKHILKEVKNTREERFFNLAAIPCSTGEEAYSLSIALFDIGIPPSRFAIHALDICKRSIDRAKKAVYGEYSFRLPTTEYKARYFQKCDDGFRVNAKVKGQVALHHGNIFSLPSVFQPRSYDAVFCRNLLIYMDDRSRKNVLAILRRLMTPSSLLFVGHSEMSIALNGGFKRKMDGGLGLMEEKPVPGMVAEKRRQESISRQTRRPKKETRQHSIEAGISLSNKNEKTAPPTQGTSAEELGRIRKYADAGRLDEAQTICNEHIERGKQSGELYYLLGLIMNAKGEHTIARQCFRKAVYLEPNHADARQHLMIIDKKICPKKYQ